jgi:hypothetical protein
MSHPVAAAMQAGLAYALVQPVTIKPVFQTIEAEEVAQFLKEHFKDAIELQ